MAQFKRVINIAGSAAVVPIAATKPCRGYTIKESLLKADGTTPNTPVGFIAQDLTVPSQPNIQFPAPSTTNEPGDFPTFKVGVDEDASFHGPHGLGLGNGPNYVVGVGATLATTLCNITSAGAATAVEVTEYV